MLSWRRRGLVLFDKLTGHNSQERFEELIRTQGWNREALRALQLRRLASLLTCAYAHVPYYQRVFDEVGFRPAMLEQDPESFQKIPLLSKAYIREHPQEFMTTEAGRRQEMVKASTSGTTGRPFEFWEDGYFQDYANANTFRHHTWCGWQPGQPRAYLWATPYELSFKQDLRARIRDFIWNRHFVNAFNLCDETMNHLAQIIRRHKPKLLHGYPSSLYAFAQFVRANGWQNLKLPAVYTTSEVLHPYQRAYLEETFDCKVFNRYATTEVSGIACECEQHAGMHISTETNYVEIIKDGLPAEPGQPGTVVVTCLTNYVFPFIRYRLDDVASMRAEPCPCGRAQPMLQVVEGRLVDMFRTRNGRTNIHSSLFEVQGIRQFQTVQKALDRVVVRLVVDDEFKDTYIKVIEERIQRNMGPETQVTCEFHDEIPTEPSGKYRYAVCEIEE